MDPEQKMYNRHMHKKGTKKGSTRFVSSATSSAPMLFLTKIWWVRKSQQKRLVILIWLLAIR